MNLLFAIVYPADAIPSALAGGVPGRPHEPRDRRRGDGGDLLGDLLRHAHQHEAHLHDDGAAVGGDELKMNGWQTRALNLV